MNCVPSKWKTSRAGLPSHCCGDLGSMSRRSLCHLLECLITAERSYGLKTLSLCYTTDILKLFVGAAKPGLS